MNMNHQNRKEKITTIIPAIMPEDFRIIEKDVERVLGTVSTVQIDIMDGILTPDATWPFIQMKKNDGIGDDAWQDLSDEERGLPHWDEIDYELDLMISDPDMWIDKMIALGPKRIILHRKTLGDEPEKLMSKLQGVRDIIEIGIAVENDANLERDLFPHIPVIDCVQVMGIAEIGKQGEDFDNRTLNTVKEIRTTFPHVIIQIDGSINENTIQSLKDAGADRFVAGSAIFGEGIPRDGCVTLHDILTEE